MTASESIVYGSLMLRIYEEVLRYVRLNMAVLYGSGSGHQLYGADVRAIGTGQTFRDQPLQR